MKKLIIIAIILFTLSSFAQDVEGNAKILMYSEGFATPLKADAKYTINFPVDKDKNIVRNNYDYKIYNKKNDLFLTIKVVKSDDAVSFCYKTQNDSLHTMCIKREDFKPLINDDGTVNLYQYLTKDIPPMNIMYHKASDKYLIIKFSYSTGNTVKNYNTVEFEVMLN